MRLLHPHRALDSEADATPQARGGYYSAYVGAVVDLVRILATTHTAQYQYIPALALPKENELNLRLNNPPSFRNPKSVIVVGLLVYLIQLLPIEPPFKTVALAIVILICIFWLVGFLPGPHFGRM